MIEKGVEDKTCSYDVRGIEYGARFIIPDRAGAFLPLFRRGLVTIAMPLTEKQYELTQ